MNKGFSSVKASRDIKIDQTLVNSWLDKNLKNFPTKTNKMVGVSDCPRPWG